MTDTLTIRPTPTKDVKAGDRIRWNSRTLTVDRIAETGLGFFMLEGDDLQDTFIRPDAYLDVIVDTSDPEPELPAWPTAPLIRITKGTRWERRMGDGYIPKDISGAIAIRYRDNPHAYRDDISESYLAKDDDEAEITEWEDLTAIRSDLIKELREAKEEADADPEPDGPWCFFHLAAVARDILYDADRSQP